MPDQDQVLPIYFPVNGIDLSTEFELQLAQTTPVGDERFVVLRTIDFATGDRLL